LCSVSLLSASIAAASPSARASVASAADCQPLGATPCVLPFPNDLFTRRDRSAPTGLRLDLPSAAMPVTTSGQPISVAEYDRNDGFSPGSTLVVHVPGLDNPKAFQRTNAVQLANMAQAFTGNQPIVVIDQSTGRRQLIWSELDANATSPRSTDLLIHPGTDFTEGHTYIVALRRLRDAGGHPIGAPSWFERLRDSRSLPPTERSQGGRYARIFRALSRAGIARGDLYEAWSFTVASRQSLTSRMLAIRNDAFSQLGDHNLADGKVQGVAPSFSVTSTRELTPQVRTVQGTFTVPCYLATCGQSATTGFHYNSSKRDAVPTQIPGNVAKVPFECVIPSSASGANPARISLYGHGFLGSRKEIELAHVQEVATTYNMVFCATDWWGLAHPDKPYDISALRNVNKLPAVVDRIQQGVLNTLYLGRLMINTRGLASSSAFRLAGRPLIDTSHLYYEGISDGGILGGITTALAPDFRRAALLVTGIDFFDLMAQRGISFRTFAGFAFHHYSDQSMHPVLLDLIQQLWDRGDPAGYAQHMTSAPLPDTPSHVVLMQVAYGDHQVSTYAAALEARTIGASVHAPALDFNTNRARDSNIVFGIPAIGASPFAGSALVIWDSGPGRVQPPPLANVPPVESPTNRDPHPDVRFTPAAQQQMSDFLTPDGAVVDVCGGAPCRTSAYVP
jgi:hypothetical protein